MAGSGGVKVPERNIATYLLIEISDNDVNIIEVISLVIGIIAIEIKLPSILAMVNEIPFIAIDAFSTKFFLSLLLIKKSNK